MKIQQIYTHSPLRNFCYIVSSDDASVKYCIDPYNAEQLYHFLVDKKLTAIINTHEHFDHICGNEDLQKLTNCEIWAHANAKGKIAGVKRFLVKGDRLPLGDDYLEVMDTPGHTMAHLCLLAVQKFKPYAVFTGDTLFNAGVGNCHHGGDPEVLYRTICEQFQTLEDDVLVYPGHDYMQNNLRFTLDRERDNEKARALLKACEQQTDKGNSLVANIGLEKEVNTFLRLDSKSVRQSLLEKLPHLEHSALNDKQVFLGLRELRNKW